MAALICLTKLIKKGVVERVCFTLLIRLVCDPSHFCLWLCEREGGKWEVLMEVILPSLALCNMIRAHHEEAGPCGPASCRPTTTPHG